MNDLEKAKDICRSEYCFFDNCNSCKDIVQALTEVRQETVEECARIAENYNATLDSKIEYHAKSIGQFIRERFLK